MDTYLDGVRLTVTKRLDPCIKSGDVDHTLQHFRDMNWFYFMDLVGYNTCAAHVLHSLACKEGLPQRAPSSIDALGKFRDEGTADPEKT